MLLLHSFPFDSRIWASTGVADASTAAGRSVIAADRRGNGRSVGPTITAVAVMQLWEQGLVELDASASDCLRVCASGAAGCLQARLTGLRDAPRAGAPQTITDEQVALATAETLTERGPGRDSHWSTRSIAAATRPGIRTARCRIGRGGSLAQGLARLVRRGGTRAQGPRSCRPLDLARVRRRARWWALAAPPSRWWRAAWRGGNRA